jgi:TolA-binding protein
MHSSQNQYRERDVFARGSEQRMGELEYYDESPPTEPMMTSDVPSLGKRMFRTSARFLIAVLIGVGATLAWQSYRGEAREMVRAWAPSLGWLLPVSTTETVAATATLVQELKPISLDLALVRHTLQQLATNQDQLAAKQDQLAAKQDQLAGRQEQMAQNIATLQDIEQGVRQKILSLPSPQAVNAARKPPPAPAPPATEPPRQ